MSRQPERRGLRLGRLMIVVAVAGLVLSVTIRPLTQHAVRISRLMEFGPLSREAFDLIAKLQPTQPATVSPGVWDDARGMVQTGFGNVCFDPDHVTILEMTRFRDDLKAKLGARVDLGTLVWIWERLGRTGPHGEQYVRRFEANFRDTLPLGWR